MISIQQNLRDMSQSAKSRIAQDYLRSLPPGRLRTKTITTFINKCPVKVHVSPDANDEERLYELLLTMRFIDWYTDAVDEYKRKNGVCLCDAGQQEWLVFNKHEMKCIMKDLRNLIRTGEVVAPEAYLETVIDMCGTEQYMFVLSGTEEPDPVSMLGFAHDKRIVGQVFVFTTKENRDAVYKYITK